MRRVLAVLLGLGLAMGLLTGCGNATHQDQITVVVEELEGCTILDNGQTVYSGEDVTFHLTLEDGYALGETDYPDGYGISKQGDTFCLTLHQVRYPTRVRLGLSQTWCVLTFDPNGGQGTAVEILRDLTYHARPNTEPALFSREGYTQVGWNTEPDGSGTAVGLGSRVTLPQGEDGLTLYAQWASWSPEEDFSYEIGEEGVTLTACHSQDKSLVIPERIQGKPVTTIAQGTFVECPGEQVVLPPSIQVVEEGAFQHCAIQTLTFFDNIVSLPTEAFENCPDLEGVNINAQLPPYGYHYRRESLLADKLDLLILAAGQKKLVCYGGCSMWFNLDGEQMQQAVGTEYQVINTAINGMVNSGLQMEIITSYLEEGDIFFHTPELGSDAQMMVQTGFTQDDDKLWSGLEYNYDLLKGVDIRHYPGFLDSFQQWRQRKNGTGVYDETFSDRQGRQYYDPDYGCVPFSRNTPAQELQDEVDLDPERIQGENMARLEGYYDAMAAKGVRVYLSHACINVDEIPSEQNGLLSYLEKRFRDYTDKMESVTVVSALRDYLYRREDFYDTNYHLLSGVVRRNTNRWIGDLKKQMELDGLWTGETG